MTRELARGLFPVLSEARGLMSALERWSGEVSDLFHVSCHFECPGPVLIHDETLAEHLYTSGAGSREQRHQAWEARNITIALAVNGSGKLSVREDGSGFTVGTPGHQPGIRFADHELSGAISSADRWSLNPSRRGDRGQLHASPFDQGIGGSPCRLVLKLRGGRSAEEFLIVDDHPIVRQGLALFINREADLVVCGDAEEAGPALQRIEP